MLLWNPALPHFPTESSQLSTSHSCCSLGIQLRTQDEATAGEGEGWSLLLLKSGRKFKALFPSPATPGECRGGSKLLGTLLKHAIFCLKLTQKAHPKGLTLFNQ